MVFVLDKFWDTFKTSKQSLYNVCEVTSIFKLGEGFVAVTSIFKLGEGFVAEDIPVHQYRLTSR